MKRAKRATLAEHKFAAQLLFKWALEDFLTGVRFVCLGHFGAADGYIERGRFALDRLGIVYVDTPIFFEPSDPPKWLRDARAAEAQL